MIYKRDEDSGNISEVFDENFKTNQGLKNNHLHFRHIENYDKANVAHEIMLLPLYIH